MHAKDISASIRYQQLQIASNCRIHTLGKVFDVTAIQSGHRDPAIHSHVDVCFFSEGLALLSIEPSVTKLSLA
jgi:hypothetical protein